MPNWRKEFFVDVTITVYLCICVSAAWHEIVRSFHFISDLPVPVPVPGFYFIFFLVFWDIWGPQLLLAARSTCKHIMDFYIYICMYVCLYMYECAYVQHPTVSTRYHGQLESWQLELIALQVFKFSHFQSCSQATSGMSFLTQTFAPKRWHCEK